MNLQQLVDTVGEDISKDWNEIHSGQINWALDRVGIKTIDQYPKYGSFDELIDQTNTKHSEIEQAIDNVISVPDVGRGEFWILSTMFGDVDKMCHNEGNGDILYKKNWTYEIKEQVGDMRFYHTPETRELTNQLKRELATIDKGIRTFYSNHSLAEEWKDLEVLSDEFSKAKFKKVEGILKKLKKCKKDFTVDRMLVDSINYKFTYERFVNKMTKYVVSHCDGIVVVNKKTNKYHMVNDPKQIRFQRFTRGQLKFKLID